MSRILIVDDSKTSRKMLRNILEAAGHTIVGEAQTGQAGVSQYRALRPDITTMDITMPLMDGLEALQEIRSQDPSAVVIMVTAAGQQKKVLEALKYGAAEFVSKPFEADDIEDVIRKVSH
ncbi:MAG: response regulator [Lachnospiraceae bacterium]